MRVLIHNPGKMFRLIEEDDGSLVLEIVVGTIGMYELDIPLTDEEKQMYLDEGDWFVKRMVDNVVSRPSEYESRARKPS